jgi:3-isopropylmalate/(R)-2-methylmalate dehydratase small subunit
MRAYKQQAGIVAHLDRPNVDTDIIIPKQYLKSIKRTGFGINLFDELRYIDEGWPGKPLEDRQLNPDFVLNQERYQGASVLLARVNFGCGSSREHAPWALDDYGFRVVIAPSFADIFYNNCFKNGLLPLVLSEQIVDRLFNEVEANPGYKIEVNLQEQQVILPDGESFSFEIDGFRKECLINGLDDIGLTLESEPKIRAYDANRRQHSPWLFDVISPEKIG